MRAVVEPFRRREAAVAAAVPDAGALDAAGADRADDVDVAVQVDVGQLETEIQRRNIVRLSESGALPQDDRRPPIAISVSRWRPCRGSRRGSGRRCGIAGVGPAREHDSARRSRKLPRPSPSHGCSVAAPDVCSDEGRSRSSAPSRLTSAMSADPVSLDANREPLSRCEPPSPVPRKIRARPAAGLPDQPHVTRSVFASRFRSAAVKLVMKKGAGVATLVGELAGAVPEIGRDGAGVAGRDHDVCVPVTVEITSREIAGCNPARSPVSCSRWTGSPRPPRCPRWSRRTSRHRASRPR